MRIAGRLRSILLSIISASFLASSVAASEDCAAGADTLSREGALKVFFENFPLDYIRERIPFVNCVRDPRIAELYAALGSLSSPSGGTEYTIELRGRGRFAGMDDTLKYYSGPTEVYDEAREGVVRTLSMGLMRYVARTPLAGDITIASRPAAPPRAVADPWDSWVMSVSASGGLSGSQLEGDYSLRGSLSASRVTESLKIDCGGYASYGEDETALTSRTLKNIYRTNSFDALVVASVTDRWSAGGFASADYSTTGSRRTVYAIAPAVEFSVFPYREASHRAVTFLYRVEYSDVTYHDITIYDRLTERLWRHVLSGNVSMYRQWGSAHASLSGSQYLHDTSINSVSAYMTLSYRLFMGFSFNLSGSYTRNHDLIDQPRRSLTDEEILLQLRSLAETYSYNFSAGFSYTFGSIYSNVVNPRF